MENMGKTEKRLEDFKRDDTSEKRAIMEQMTKTEGEQKEIKAKQVGLQQTVNDAITDSSNKLQAHMSQIDGLDKRIKQESDRSRQHIEKEKEEIIKKLEVEYVKLTKLNEISEENQKRMMEYERSLQEENNRRKRAEKLLAQSIANTNEALTQDIRNNTSAINESYGELDKKIKEDKKDQDEKNKSFRDLIHESNIKSTNDLNKVEGDLQENWDDQKQLRTSLGTALDRNWTQQINKQKEINERLEGLEGLNDRVGTNEYNIAQIDYKLDDSDEKFSQYKISSSKKRQKIRKDLKSIEQKQGLNKFELNTKHQDHKKQITDLEGNLKNMMDTMKIPDYKTKSSGPPPQKNIFKILEEKLEEGVGANEMAIEENIQDIRQMENKLAMLQKDLENTSGLEDQIDKQKNIIKDMALVIKSLGKENSKIKQFVKSFGIY